MILYDIEPIQTGSSGKGHLINSMENKKGWGQMETIKKWENVQLTFQVGNRALQSKILDKVRKCLDV